MYLNLQKKLLLFFILLATLPFIVVGYVQISITESELISSVNDRLSFVSSDLANKVDQNYEDQWFRPITFMKEILQNDDIDANAKITSLKEISNFKGYIAVQLSVRGAEKSILIIQDNYKQQLNLNNEDARALFETKYDLLELLLLDNNHHISTPQYFKRTNDWIVTISSRLDKDIQGQPAILTLQVSAKTLLRSIRNHPFNELGKIELLDHFGNVLFTKNNANRSKNAFENRILRLLKNGTRAVGVTPFINGNREMLGSYAIPQFVDWIVVVSRDKKLAYLSVSKMIQNLLFWSSLGIIFALFGAHYFAKVISTPIVAIDKVAEQVKGGNFDIKVPENKSKDEIGHLTVQFNEMIDGLKDRERVKNIFGRYQSKEVVDQLLNSSDALGLGGERKNITLLMTDIRGFTAMSEKYPPEEVVAILNHYFEIMIDIMEKYNGTLNEIIGDALFVIFGAPTTIENHADMAIACALEMQQAMKLVNQDNAKKNRPELEMGIGINTGDVVVGNIGSTKRTKYGVVGADVNLTGRIESYTVGRQILISEYTQKACHAELEIKSEFKVHPKGVSNEISILEVVAIGAPYSIKLDLYKETRSVLYEEIPVTYQLLDGKHINGEKHMASILELGYETATLRSDNQLKVLSNISISLADESLKEFEIYGKVIKANNAINEVRFTSIPEEVYNLFADAKSLKDPT